MRINYFVGLILFCSGIFLMTSCEKEPKEEEIPSYIHIESISVIAKPSEGSSSSKVKDAWVYIGNDLQGIYELPVTFPVLKAGTQNISIRPGILINGIANTRGPFPFYTFFDGTYTLARKEKLDMGKLTVNYRDNLAFPLMEDFENAGVKFSSTSGSTTDMGVTSVTGEVFEGKSSGIVKLDKDKSIFEAVSTGLLLPKNLSSVFLEMNYNTNNSINIGLRIKTPTSVSDKHMMTLNPTTGWNKIYIELGELLAANQSAIEHRLLIHAGKDEGVTNAFIYFDNIKIVHGK